MINIKKSFLNYITFFPGLLTVPTSPTAISITVTFMLRSFFSSLPRSINSLPRSIYLSISSFSFLFYSIDCWNCKFHQKVFVNILLVQIRRSICILKSQWILCILLSRTDSGLSICPCKYGQICSPMV